jgi:hypothetical protein
MLHVGDLKSDQVLWRNRKQFIFDFKTTYIIIYSHSRSVEPLDLAYLWTMIDPEAFDQ